MPEILMHQAFDFGKDGPIYQFEFFDGTPLDLEEVRRLEPPRQITLKPRRGSRDKEIQEILNDIQRGMRARQYPRSIFATGHYRDQIDQKWIRGYYIDKDGESIDMIFNATYWSWT